MPTFSGTANVLNPMTSRDPPTGMWPTRIFEKRYLIKESRTLPLLRGIRFRRRGVVIISSHLQKQDPVVRL